MAEETQLPVVVNGQLSKMVFNVANKWEVVSDGSKDTTNINIKSINGKSLDNTIFERNFSTNLLNGIAKVIETLRNNAEENKKSVNGVINIFGKVNLAKKEEDKQKKNKTPDIDKGKTIALPDPFPEYTKWYTEQKAIVEGAEKQKYEYYSASKKTAEFEKDSYARILNYKHSESELQKLIENGHAKLYQRQVLYSIDYQRVLKAQESHWLRQGTLIDNMGVYMSDPARYVEETQKRIYEKLVAPINKIWLTAKALKRFSMFGFDMFISTVPKIYNSIANGLKKFSMFGWKPLAKLGELMSGGGKLLSKKLTQLGGFLEKKTGFGWLGKLFTKAGTGKIRGNIIGSEEIKREDDSNKKKKTSSDKDDVSSDNSVDKGISLAEAGYGNIVISKDGRDDIDRIKEENLTKEFRNSLLGKLDKIIELLSLQFSNTANNDSSGPGENNGGFVIPGIKKLWDWTKNIFKSGWQKIKNIFGGNKVSKSVPPTTPKALPAPPPTKALPGPVSKSVPPTTPKAKIPKVAGKFLGTAGTAIAVVEGGLEVKDALERGDTKGAVAAGVGTATGIAGGILGAKAGAATGALIGSFVPIAGTMVGGILGSIIGGTMGYFAGDAVGRTIVDKVMDDNKTPIDDAKKTIHSLSEKEEAVVKAYQTYYKTVKKGPRSNSHTSKEMYNQRKEMDLLYAQKIAKENGFGDKDLYLKQIAFDRENLEKSKIKNSTSVKSKKTIKFSELNKNTQKDILKQKYLSSFENLDEYNRNDTTSVRKREIEGLFSANISGASYLAKNNGFSFKEIAKIKAEAFQEARNKLGKEKFEEYLNNTKGADKFFNITNLKKLAKETGVKTDNYSNNSEWFYENYVKSQPYKPSKKLLSTKDLGIAARNKQKELFKSDNVEYEKSISEYKRPISVSANPTTVIKKSDKPNTNINAVKGQNLTNKNNILGTSNSKIFINNGKIQGADNISKEKARELAILAYEKSLTYGGDNLTSSQKRKQRSLSKLSVHEANAWAIKAGFRNHESREELRREAIKRIGNKIGGKELSKRIEFAHSDMQNSLEDMQAEYKNGKITTSKPSVQEYKTNKVDATKQAVSEMKANTQTNNSNQQAMQASLNNIDKSLNVIAANTSKQQTVSVPMLVSEGIADYRGA